MFTDAAIDELIVDARRMVEEWERDPALRERAARWREIVLRIIQYAGGGSDERKRR
jgi:hypothetical protein